VKTWLLKQKGKAESRHRLMETWLTGFWLLTRACHDELHHFCALFKAIKHFLEACMFGFKDTWFYRRVICLQSQLVSKGDAIRGKKKL
jgi:hypothetical protein